MNAKISPSLMCMDLMNVEKEIRILSPVSDYFHIDILDWHYCKNLCLAPCFMEQLKPLTDVPLEAHLMVDNIDGDLVELCISSGADIITMPPEVIANKAFRLIRQIKDAGKKVGIYINPGMNLEFVQPYIHMIDILDIMTVDPGFPGQRFVPESVQKIWQAKQMREENGYSYLIEVDGSCNQDTYAQLYEAGAEIFVMGSTGLFGKDPDIAKAWEIMRGDMDMALDSVLQR